MGTNVGNLLMTEGLVKMANRTKMANISHLGYRCRESSAVRTVMKDNVAHFRTFPLQIPREISATAEVSDDTTVLGKYNFELYQGAHIRY